MQRAYGDHTSDGNSNVNLQRRIHHVIERNTEHEKNEEIKLRGTVHAIRRSIATEERISQQRIEQREWQFQRLQQQEMTRLEEILEADKEGRDEEKREKEEEALKRKNKRNRNNTRLQLQPLPTSRSSKLGGL